MSTDNVDNVTDAMAKATVSDNNVEKANETAANDAGAEGRRLYVGNLAYATTEEELKAFFKDFSVYVIVLCTR